MSKNKGNKKETNFLLIIIIILIIMVVMSFIGFSILFIKYLDTNSTNSIQNISVETKNEDKISKDLEIGDKKTVSKEEIVLRDGIMLGITRELIGIEADILEVINMYLNYEISKSDLGYVISIAKDEMQKVVSNDSNYSIDPNAYTKAVDEYTLKLNEFILNLDKGINGNDLSYIKEIDSILKELETLQNDIFLKRIEYLKENGFSDDEIDYIFY